jgi:hypothetical protein
MIYGYARVSTEAQDLTGSTAQLKAAGCQKIFREKITGTTADRPQLKKLMAALAHGDVVIIPAVDRLSRDTTDLLIIARELQRAGAGIRSLAEPFLDTTSDFAEIWLGRRSMCSRIRFGPRDLVRSRGPDVAPSVTAWGAHDISGAGQTGRTINLATTAACGSASASP